jgi:hypothetical protein
MIQKLLAGEAIEGLNDKNQIISEETFVDNANVTDELIEKMGLGD